MVARLRRTVVAGQPHAIVLDMQDALLAHEPESGGLIGPLLEVHAQAHIKGRMARSFGIIGQPQHQIGDFPSVIPITGAASGHHPLRPFRVEHEVYASKQVHEQIARNASAIIPIVVPPEKPLRVEGPSRSVGHEAIPIDGRRRSVRWNRITEHQFVSVHRPLPPGFNQI